MRGPVCVACALAVSAALAPGCATTGVHEQSSADDFTWRLRLHVGIDSLRAAASSAVDAEHMTIVRWDTRSNEIETSYVTGGVQRSGPLGSSHDSVRYNFTLHFVPASDTASSMTVIPRLEARRVSRAGHAVAKWEDISHDRRGAVTSLEAWMLDRVERVTTGRGEGRPRPTFAQLFPQQLASEIPAQPGGVVPLTSADVLRMVRAHIGDAVIVARLRTAPLSFDVSTDSLLSLKQAGVSDTVLQAMVEGMARGPVRSPSGVPAPVRWAPGGIAIGLHATEATWNLGSIGGSVVVGFGALLSIEGIAEFGDNLKSFGGRLRLRVVGTESLLFSAYAGGMQWTVSGAVPGPGYLVRGSEKSAGLSFGISASQALDRRRSVWLSEDMEATNVKFSRVLVVLEQPHFALGLHLRL